ncbi:3-oxo-tetronate kinase [Paragemmobacter straminiformis]|uniref:3-oxo-tetronate kinase n=1 Tax=Paragemmobacter straminiformis TaxID=2045119 RepID=A0A842I6D4_9RHOB|nr:3-oxo-tetronate kinase [Gemmobacter straminiformis]MBC2834508.1 four-carbon acid sugar kinase family protein [Gemmobacter straminiformis]
MTTFFGAIADDLTGATDLAGLLARSGVPVSLRMGVPKGEPSETAALEIIALKCRTEPVAVAVNETRAALNWLRRAGAVRFFWKYCSTFDSTPDGNIGPVAEALIEELGVDQTIYCPAFPENGRSIFMGNLFVGEQPLAESPMKDHPLTPMRDSNLMRLLAPQVKRPVGLANRHVVARGAGALSARLEELRAHGVAHVVVDAVSNDDLTVIATACQDMTLLTGGSAVAMALPKLWADQGKVARGATARAGILDGPAVLLSGSCSAMTNRQVAAALAAGRPGFRLDPVCLADQGAGAALDWLRSQDLARTPLIYATAEPQAVKDTQARLGRERAGKLVEDALAACAVVARDKGARRFVVAGGETSGAVAKALHIDRLDVGQEIAPGVPWCFAESEGQKVAITLKSGNFGAETFFADALERLG